MSSAQTPLRVGFVGAGAVARRHHACLRDRTDVEIVAVCDLVPERATELAAFSDAQVFTSIERMLRAQVPDALWIGVPPRAHGALESRLAQAGCALYIEPPLALSLRAASTLSAACKRAGVPVCVGSPWRYSSAFGRARRLFSGKGAPIPALVNGFWSGPRATTAWQRDPKSGGGLWLEAAWPLLDIARALVGEPRRIGARSLASEIATDHGASAPDMAAMWTEFSGGALGSFCAARLGPCASRLEIVTPTGVARLEDLETNRLSFTWESADESLRVAPAEDALTLAHDAFLRAVAHGKRLDLRATLPDAHKTLAWALAATRTTSAAQPISLTP